LNHEGVPNSNDRHACSFATVVVQLAQKTTVPRTRGFDIRLDVSKKVREQFTDGICIYDAPAPRRGNNEQNSYVERKQFNLFTIATDGDGIAAALHKTA